MSIELWESPGFNASLATQAAFPYDTQCWANLTTDGDTQVSLSFKDATDVCAHKLGYHVTQPMVDFLNLTQNTEHYFEAYCLNPRSDDSCPFNYCSQSDVAGILVRVSTYIATLCLAIMLFFSDEPDEVTEAYWSQLLTLYSILVAAAISIFQTPPALTKFHAIIAVELVASPLTFYLAIYAIRSFFNNEHRLDRLLGRGKLHYRVMAIGTLALLVAFYIYILLPSHVQKFSQASCDAKSILVKANFLLPVIFFFAIFAYGGILPGILVALPFIFIAFSWVSTVYIRRQELWYKSGKRRNPTFWNVWSMVGKNYPFIHFMAVYIIPYTLWVMTVEFSLMGSNDQRLEVSFGQILAVFVTIPPLISVAKMSPRFVRWFIDLAWVRFVTGRPQNSLASHDPVPLAFVGSSGQSATIVNWPRGSNSKYEELKDMEAGYDDPFDTQKRSGITKTH